MMAAVLDHLWQSTLLALGLAPRPQAAVLIQQATAPLSRFPFERSSLARTAIAPPPIAHPAILQVPSSPLMTPAVHVGAHLNLGLFLLALWAAGAPTGLAASDAAYLTSLYKADLETRRNFAEADISDRMAQLLIKAWAPSSRQ